MLPCSCHLQGGCPSTGSLCLYFVIISMPRLSQMSKVLLRTCHLPPFCECLSSDASSLKGLTHLSGLNADLLLANLANLTRPSPRLAGRLACARLAPVAPVPHGH